MQINNKDAHKLVSIFGKAGCIVTGSYARSSHENEYKDIDFITLKPLNDIYKEISNKFDKIEVLKNGNKYMSLLLDGKYNIDIWYSTKSDFYKTYMLRTLAKEKLIYINKILKNESK